MAREKSSMDPAGIEHATLRKEGHRLTPGRYSRVDPADVVEIVHLAGACMHQADRLPFFSDTEWCNVLFRRGKSSGLHTIADG